MIFRRLTCVMSVLLVCMACQSPVPDPARPVTPATSFMAMWDGYQHCRTHDDLGEILSDVDHLSVWAGHSSPPPSPVLRSMQSSSNPPSVRTAADPNAMLADCTLRAAHLAKDQRLFDLAEDLYKKVSEELPHDRYAYYVREAKAGLDDLPQASITPP